MKKYLQCASFLCLLAGLHVAPSFAEDKPPSSPEVTAAMQPYLDNYKLGGVIAVIADKTGKVHYRNLLGYADVEAKEDRLGRRVCVLGRFHVQDVRRRIHYDVGG